MAFLHDLFFLNVQAFCFCRELNKDMGSIYEERVCRRHPKQIINTVMLQVHCVVLGKKLFFWSLELIFL